MVTKTKPIKDWGMSFLPNIRMAEDRRAQVLAMLGLDELAAGPVIDEIEMVLKFGPARIHAREREPLPAHLLAELQPVAQLARELAEAINSLSSMARVMPGPDVAGTLWHAAVEFHANTSIICDRLERQGQEYQEARKTGAIEVPHGGSDGGARKANVRAAKDGVRAVLESIYDSHAAQPTTKGRKSFIDLVTGKRQRG